MAATTRSPYSPGKLGLTGELGRAVAATTRSPCSPGKLGLTGAHGRAVAATTRSPCSPGKLGLTGALGRAVAATTRSPCSPGKLGLTGALGRAVAATTRSPCSPGKLGLTGALGRAVAATTRSPRHPSVATANGLVRLRTAAGWPGCRSSVPALAAPETTSIIWSVPLLCRDGVPASSQWAEQGQTSRYFTSEQSADTPTEHDYQQAASALCGLSTQPALGAGHTMAKPLPAAAGR